MGKDKANIDSFIHFLINNAYLREKLNVPELIVPNFNDDKKL